MSKIVDLKNVSKIYQTGEKEFKAIDNIDLGIEKGKSSIKKVNSIWFN